MKRPDGRKRSMKIVSPVLIALFALSAFLASACSGSAATIVTFTHGAVTPTTIVMGNDGGAVGAVRTFHAEAATDDGTSGTFDATMVTTSVDEAAGLERRLTTIVFSVSDGADQLILSGSAVYPAAGSTIKTAATVVRPIIGGSGRWSGARGWAESTHEADGSWTHEFHLEP